MHLNRLSSTANAAKLPLGASLHLWLHIQGKLSMDTTQSSLLVIGCVSLIAAIVGGNLKLPSTEFGKLESPLMRTILGAVGAGLVVTSFLLPSLTRAHPLKGTYLAQLDSHSIRVASAVSKLDFAAHLKLLRQFSDEWHGWIAPEGDDKTVADLQGRFSGTVNQIEAIGPLYKRTFYGPTFDHDHPTSESLRALASDPDDPKKIDAEALKELNKTIDSISRAFVDEMRNYGSTPCSNLLESSAIVGPAVREGMMNIIKSIEP